MSEPAAPLAGGFRRAEIGVGGDEQVRRLTTMLDLQEAQPGVVRLRDWAFERLAPRAGETVVDVGSGTGATVLRCAGVVGRQGRAVGVEPNPALRRVAAERAAAAGPAAAAAEFVDGAADDLPFEDASVDVITCERVLQHLDEPEAAVREFARVLRPGGRVAVLDSDWATAITHPGDPDVVRRYRTFTFTQWPNPFSGRFLRGQLLAAGLEVDRDIGSSALVLPEEALRGGAMLGLSGPGAVASGAVTAEELSALLADLEAAVDRGDDFVSVTMFAAIGRRPAHPRT